MSMRLVILGAPGAGKGTQAKSISGKLQIPHISTGDIFRENIKAGSPLGKMAREYIDKGMLVPDEVTIEIVKDRLQQEDCMKGFILDGFPRTMLQAESLDGILSNLGIKLDHVLNIVVSDKEIVRRLSGRRVCPACGAIWHIDHSQDAAKGLCADCGIKLIQREDDREVTIVERLKTYHAQTEPLISYYRAKGLLLEVNGRQMIADTTAAVDEALGLKE